MSKGAVWITRTLPGANDSARLFKAKGYESVIAPLLTIAPYADMPKPPPLNAILIFTSKNGLSAFTLNTDKRHWPVVTVGDSTAKRARELGFETVYSASGTWEDVVTKVKSKFSSKDQPVYHISGKHVRGHIVETLKRSGYSARREIFYASDPVIQLPDLDLSTMTHIAIYSPLAAKTLAGFKPDLSHLTTVCISRGTDTELDGLNIQHRLIAQTPDETAMLSCLD